MRTLAELEEYVSRAERLVGEEQPATGELERLLNGGPNAVIRSVPLVERKALGAFFTPPGLAERLVAPHVPHLVEGGAVLDPACGAGELLMAAARLALGRIRSGQLLGFDLVGEFVRLCRARLAIACGGDRWNESILVSDGVQALSRLEPGVVVVMNPPFSQSNWPKGEGLGRGRVNLAAIFLQRAISALAVGGKISAILPDVIRNGARYEKLRGFVACSLSSMVIEDVGRFDHSADVDVFILHGIKGEAGRARSEWPLRRSDSREKVGERFTVRVGSVVPHRDLEYDQIRSPYLDVSNAVPWGVVMAKKLPLRGFSGTKHRPPFVVVRRTSSPSDRWRAVGSIVRGRDPVSVENHLVLLKPKEGGVARCEELLRVLRSSSVNEWLNSAIRCRHLTVGVLRDLPFER